MRGCAFRYGARLVFQDWRELIAADIDAVMILTSGSHAEMAVAAAQAGKHVFRREATLFLAGRRARHARRPRRATGVVMLVGYNKRYDPAFQTLQERDRARSMTSDWCA